MNTVLVSLFDVSLLTFLGVASIPTLLLWKRDRLSEIDRGFVLIVVGTTGISIATFLSYSFVIIVKLDIQSIISIPAWNSREIFLVLLLYFPGALSVGLGLSSWLPALQRQAREVENQKVTRQLQIAFDASPTISSITRVSDGKYIDVNAAFLETLGYSRNEVIGYTVEELKIWTGTQDRGEIVSEIQQNGFLRNFETTVCKSDGNIFPALYNGVAFRMNDEDCILSNTIDLSERKQLEEQFRRSQKLEAVGQLTGGIAHDFNNLMAIMMGNLELAMEQTEPDASLRSNIENALKAVERGAVLTQQLLSFSRQQTLSPAVTDVKQLVEGTLTFLKRTLGENIQMVTEHIGEESCVNIDATVFGTALVNLAINGRDAMVDGGILTVRTATVELTGETIGLDKQPTYGSHALITVSDTGSGISQDDLGQVLEPFFTTKEVGKGSGLGLSMVYGFVTQSNGHMNITSKEGEGTTISIYLPISDEKLVDKGDEAAPFPKINIDKTILLVEDDQQVRETTSATLLNLGYRVIEAEDGSSALKLLNQRSGDIDLVLSDIVMPNGMSGIDLAKQISADHNHIKILLTSGYPDKIAGQDEIKPMKIELLAKPFRRAQLVAAIESATSDQTED